MSIEDDYVPLHFKKDPETNQDADLATTAEATEPVPEVTDGEMPVHSEEKSSDETYERTTKPEFRHDIGAVEAIQLQYTHTVRSVDNAYAELGNAMRIRQSGINSSIQLASQKLESLATKTGAPYVRNALLEDLRYFVGDNSLIEALGENQGLPESLPINTDTTNLETAQSEYSEVASLYDFINRRFLMLMQGIEEDISRRADKLRELMQTSQDMTSMVRRTMREHDGNVSDDRVDAVAASFELILTQLQVDIMDKSQYTQYVLRNALPQAYRDLEAMEAQITSYYNSVIRPAMLEERNRPKSP